MERRRGELTPLLLLLFSWSFCQAGFTGQQPIRLHCDNCIFVMKKKYKLNFIRKKTPKIKSIVFRIWENLQTSTWILLFFSPLYMRQFFQWFCTFRPDSPAVCSPTVTRTSLKCLQN